MNFIQNLLFVSGMHTYMYINIASSTLSKDLLEINNVFRMELNIESKKLSAHSLLVEIVVESKSNQ